MYTMSEIPFTQSQQCLTLCKHCKIILYIGMTL
jgi:hypothetical protein